MLIQNIKSGAKDVVSKEEWDDMKKKMLPGDPSRSFASLFNVLDKEQMTKHNVPPNDVPVALKISPKKENKETKPWKRDVPRA